MTLLLMCDREVPGPNVVRGSPAVGLRREETGLRKSLSTVDRRTQVVWRSCSYLWPPATDHSLLPRRRRHCSAMLLWRRQAGDWFRIRLCPVPATRIIKIGYVLDENAVALL